MPSVEVDDKIYEVLEARADEKDFDKTDDYVRHILEQVVEKIKKEKQQTSSYSDEEEEEVKDRLRKLGYLD